MGAGCYYTHKCNKERAAWIDLPTSEDYTEFEYIMDDIAYILTSNGYEKNYLQSTMFQNGLFEIFFESTYYNDGLVIRIEPLIDEDRYYRLAMANHHRTEKKIHKLLAKAGYKFRIATSGYTSADFTP